MEKLNRMTKDLIKSLVNDLVEKEYNKIESDGRSGRLTQNEINLAIMDYGRTLIKLPDNAFDLIDIIPVQNSKNQIAVDIPLWTAEEGRSDLTLSVTIFQDVKSMKISIDDLHVL